MKTILISMTALLGIVFLLTGCGGDSSGLPGDFDWEDWQPEKGNWAYPDQFNAIQGSFIVGNVLDNDEFCEIEYRRVDSFDRQTALGLEIHVREEGVFTYQPSPDFYGRDSFFYHIPYIPKTFSPTIAIVKLTVISGEDAGTFTDTRDGEEYPWVRLKDGKRWMAQNLNFSSDGSWEYHNDPSHGEEYGRLYSWSSAMKACPDAWRLPTSEEINALIQLYGGMGQVYQALFWGGSSGLNLQCGGYRDEQGFWGIGFTGYYWTSTTADYVSQAITYGFGKSGSSGNFRWEYKWQTDGFACRCVEDVN